jgi:hypothetical protein
MWESTLPASAGKNPFCGGLEINRNAPKYNAIIIKT